MKKPIFAIKQIKLNVSGLSPSTLNVEDSYISAIKYGAMAGLISVFLIVTLVVLILL